MKSLVIERLATDLHMLAHEYFQLLYCILHSILVEHTALPALAYALCILTCTSDPCMV